MSQTRGALSAVQRSVTDILARQDLCEAEALATVSAKLEVVLGSLEESRRELTGQVVQLRADQQRKFQIMKKVCEDMKSQLDDVKSHGDLKSVTTELKKELEDNILRRLEKMISASSDSTRILVKLLRGYCRT